MNTNNASDLLYGVPEISTYLSMTAAQVYHLHARDEIPTFKIRKKVCALRSELDAWINEAHQRAKEVRENGKR